MTYKERVDLIAQVLEQENIPYNIVRCFEGWQIRFNWCVGDVACHDGTSGHQLDKVETYQFPWDNGDVSVLDPEEAADKIVEYYKER